MIQVFTSETVAFRDQKYVLPYLFSYILSQWECIGMHLLCKNPWSKMTFICNCWYKFQNKCSINQVGYECKSMSEEKSRRSYRYC